MHHLLEEGPTITDTKYFQRVNADSIKPDVVNISDMRRLVRLFGIKKIPISPKKEDDPRIYESFDRN